VERFGKVATTPRLHDIERQLETWDCVSCNLCVTVCPNDAMLHVATPQGLGMDEKWQYFCLAEWCNDCGNCTPFCPEIGDPSRVKPRLFVDAAAFAADEGAGYLVRVGPAGLEVEARDPADPSDPEKVVALLGGIEGWPVPRS
jgi:ferredoxin